MQPTRRELGQAGRQEEGTGRGLCSGLVHEVEAASGWTGRKEMGVSVHLQIDASWPV